MNGPLSCPRGTPPYGEFWILTYARCGHETYFSRTAHRLFEPDDVEREGPVRRLADLHTSALSLN